MWLLLLQVQERGALLPSVCAMALLPRSGRSFVPDALQHLMDTDSPVADVFDICETCEQLAAENVQLEAVSCPCILLR